MCPSLSRSFRNFAADKRGNFAMMFALASPLLAISMAAALDYSNTVELDQRAQSAADSAALAATSAMVRSIEAGSQLTAAQAQAVATSYFNANAPQAIVTSQTSFSSNTTYANGVVSTAVTYSGTPATAIGGVLGSTMNVKVASTASSSVTSKTVMPVGTYTGTGKTAEDPVVWGAQGQYWFMDACNISHNEWYNMLSDTSFEVNANCDGANYNGSLFQAELYQFEILAANHTIYITPQLNPENWGAQFGVSGLYINQEAWAGGITIDGTYYAPQSGTNTYLNDTTNQITVQVVIGQPGVYGSSNNYVLVTTPNYSVTIAYDSDDVSATWNFGLADIKFGVTNAGACGAPGGVWGQTLSSNGNDSNFEDFKVAGATTTASQFSTTCGTTIVSNNLPILTQ